MGPLNETMAIDNRNGRLFVGCRPEARRLMFPPGPRPDRIIAVTDTTNHETNHETPPASFRKLTPTDAGSLAA